MNDIEAAFVRACSVVRPWLKPERMEALERKDPDLIDICSALRIVLGETLDVDDVAISMTDLLLKTDHIFTTRYRLHLLQRVSNFDAMAGFGDHSISDTFVQGERLSVWVTKIANAMAAEADRVALSTLPRPVTGEQPVGHVDCPIIDFHLAGTNIREAWESNPTLHQMELDACNPVRQVASWNPGPHYATGHPLPVYHGTTGPFASTNSQTSS